MLPPGREGGRLWLKKENCLFGCVFCCRRFWRWYCFGAEASAQMPCWIATADPRPRKSFCRPAEEIRSANQLLFEKKTYQIIYDYSIAFLDSAIAFDFLPTYDIDGLWGLIQHLPRDMQIEKIWFSYNAVVFLFPPIPRRLCFPFWNIYKTVNNIRLFFSIQIPSPPLLLPVNSVVIFN